MWFPSQEFVGRSACFMKDLFRILEASSSGRSESEMWQVASSNSGCRYLRCRQVGDECFGELILTPRWKCGLFAVGHGRTHQGKEIFDASGAMDHLEVSAGEVVE
jgi:hypothetical protein